VANNIEFFHSRRWTTKSAGPSTRNLRDPGLSRYSVQAVPSIHIIVKNGNVTLEGVWTTRRTKILRLARERGSQRIFGEEQSGRRGEGK